MYRRNGPTLLARIFQQGGTDNLANIAANIFNAYNVRSHHPAIHRTCNFNGPFLEIGRAITDVVIVQPELPSTLMHSMGLPQRNGYQLRFIDPALKTVHNGFSQTIPLRGCPRDFGIFVARAAESVTH
jgi:hypothetical protein